jgi:hypothetical protein
VTGDEVAVDEGAGNGGKAAAFPVLGFSVVADDSPGLGAVFFSICVLREIGFFSSALLNCVGAGFSSI